MSRALREAWETAPTDPDPVADLDYRFSPLTHIHVEEGSESFIFLPDDERHLADAEFIVASPESVRPLETMQ